MQRFLPLLLEVWRLACREPRIAVAAVPIAGVIGTRLPCDRLLIRRLDLVQGRLETLASVGAQRGGEAPAHPDPGALGAWLAADEPMLAPIAALPSGLAPLVPADWQGAVAVAALCLDDEPPGVLLLGADDPAAFGPEHPPLIRALCEPLAVALRNDRQLRELRALREAAEADRRSLLQRLGRQDIADTIVGAGSGLAAVMRQVDLVAPADAPVLILGETGTGKEVVARAIHARSKRAAGPFLRVNCGAIPPELADSELFGHERGSFTGASNRRCGWFERADGGTLFLDEVGELTPAVQVRLLRILQDGSFERVGGQQVLRADVRLIAATHQDLESMVAAGRFRADLWYRIHVFPIRLPPLRERPEDIADLARHFADRAAHRLGLAPCVPGSAGVARLVAYTWPGNVRELAAVIERAAILGEGRRLAVAEALGIEPPKAPVTAAQTAAAPGIGGNRLDAAQRTQIAAALRACLGRIEGPFGAAQALGINPSTLRARMRRLGIDWRGYRVARRLAN
jgi:transcriptional regulator with GAF, ATPase, and Fis domain